ncbi:MAG TPA: BA14K family protein [Propylenella sp.]
MTKLLTTALATTFLAAASVATMSVPASAGSFHLHVGGFGGYGYGYGGGWYPGYAAPAPIYVAPQPVYGGWNAHVQWCSAKYVSYNPATNLFFYKPGKAKYCNSPYN